MIKFVLRKYFGQTWTMAARSTLRFGPGFRAAAFWMRGRNALGARKRLKPPITLNPIFSFFVDSKCSCGEGERPDINRSRKEAIRYKKVLASHKRKEMKMSNDDRIVNGFRDDSQHWMATFARNKRIFCGGAIISHRYIV